jgi:D-threo-aldose 1-dehydrogenase
VLSRPLGRSALPVTELGFGAAPIGNLYTAIDDETAHATVEAAWNAGIRYFDTAPHYGLGLSEQRLGASLAHRPRDEFTISTKVGRVLVPNPAPTGSDLAANAYAVSDDLTRLRDYSRDGVRRSLDASLERLGVDHVDIIYIHDPQDYMEPALREAIPALVELREQGVVKAIGAGMNYVEPLLRFVTETDVDVVMVAGRWTLLDRSAAPLLDACRQRNVSVVAAAPFNSGLLAKPWPADGAYFDYEPAPAIVLERARELARECEAVGVELPHAALRFPLQQAVVACVVAGMRTPAQVKACAAWIDADVARMPQID